MKVLLVNPPFRPEKGRFSREQRSPAITKGGTFYYPLWLCYAAGVLEDDGFEIKIIDAPAKRLHLPEVVEKAQAFEPRMIVVDTSTPSIASDAEATAGLKEATGAFTVLVGTHPSACPEQTLQLSPAIDAVARKEYDYTTRELARLVKDQGPEPEADALSEVKGISFLLDGEAHHTPDRELIKHLDELPFVSRVYHDHLDVRDYLYTCAQYPQVAIFSARGCPHRCFYCLYPQVMHGHGFRKRSVQDLVEEFKYIEQDLPEVREVFIEDDTFTVDARRARAFCKAYQEAELELPWIANSRADVDTETLQRMQEANCRLLCVGFESGVQEVLDGMNKRLSVERALQFRDDAAQAGILVHGCFMVGNPGETPETLEKTLEYAKALNCDTAQFFPIMVYPGTEAYRWAKENDYLTTEDYTKWNTEEGAHNCLVSRPGLTDRELVEFCDRARREFYLRPRYILYRLGRLLCHPIEDGPRMWRSLGVFWKWLLTGGDRD